MNLREVNVASNAGNFVARFVVEGTSVTIPTGILKSGSSYFVRIQSQTGGAVTKPFQYQPSGGQATTISGVFTP